MNDCSEQFFSLKTFCRTALALMIYRETIVTGLTPSMETFSQVLGCLQLPHEALLRIRLIEDLGVSAETSNYSNLSSLINGFGEYDPRALSLLEVSAQLTIIFYLHSYHEIKVRVHLQLPPNFRRLLLLEFSLVYPSKKTLLL